MHDKMALDCKKEVSCIKLLDYKTATVHVNPLNEYFDAYHYTCRSLRGLANFHLPALQVIFCLMGCLASLVAHKGILFENLARSWSSIPCSNRLGVKVR